MCAKREKDLEYIWGSVGYIIHLSSMIEQNTVLLISGEEILREFDKDDLSSIDILSAISKSNEKFRKNSSTKMMLGKLIEQLKKYELFNGDRLIDDLRIASQIRGYYAHEFFKKDLYEKHLENDPLFYKPQLQEDIDFMYRLNEELTSHVKKYQELCNKLFANTHLKK